MDDPASTPYQPHASETGGEALARALAAHHEALRATAGKIEAKRAAGLISAADEADQLHGAYAAYARDCGLAEVAAATGWKTWAGVGGILYARRPNSTPPKVVRAPSAQTLREAIERAAGLAAS